MISRNSIKWKDEIYGRKIMKNWGESICALWTFLKYFCQYFFSNKVKGFLFHRPYHGICLIKRNWFLWRFGMDYPIYMLIIIYYRQIAQWCSYLPSFYGVYIIFLFLKDNEDKGLLWINKKMGFIGPFAEEAADLMWLRLSQSINLGVQDSQLEAFLKLAQLWPTIMFHIFHIPIDSYCLWLV